MCTNCLTNAEFLAGKVALAAWVLERPARRLLADLGVVAAPDPVRRDARTVAFLRALDLDPAGVLGADAVERADRYAAQPERARRRSSWRPIGSHNLLTAQ